MPDIPPLSQTSPFACSLSITMGLRIDPVGCTLTSLQYLLTAPGRCRSHNGAEGARSTRKNVRLRRRKQVALVGVVRQPSQITSRIHRLIQARWAEDMCIVVAKSLAAPAAPTTSISAGTSSKIGINAARMKPLTPSSRRHRRYAETYAFWLCQQQSLFGVHHWHSCTGSPPCPIARLTIAAADNVHPRAHATFSNMVMLDYNSQSLRCLGRLAASFWQRSSPKSLSEAEPLCQKAHFDPRTCSN